MVRKMKLVLLLSIAIGLAGCMWLFPPEPTSTEYEFPDGGFAVRVPVAWQVEELDSLIEGVVFEDPSPGGSTMRLWILYGPASGRTGAEIIEDTQGLRVLLLESGTSLTDWVQSTTAGKTISGMPGAETSYSAKVSGLGVEGLAIACTDGVSDFVILAEVATAAFDDYLQSFNDAIRSFAKTD